MTDSIVEQFKERRKKEKKEVKAGGVGKPGVIGKARKKFLNVQARIERERLKSLRGQAVRTEAAAIRSKLREKERERIRKAKKTLGKERSTTRVLAKKAGKSLQKARQNSRNVDFGNIFFDDKPRRNSTKKRGKKPSKKKSKSRSFTIRVD